MALEYSIKLTVLSEEDGGGYIVEVPDLPGCMTTGDSPGEALSKVEDAIDTWIMAAEAMGKLIPAPKSYSEDHEYSGKISVRMPKDLHKELVEIANHQGVSLNQFVVYSLAKSAGKEIGVSEYKDQFKKHMYRYSHFFAPSAAIKENTWDVVDYRFKQQSKDMTSFYIQRGDD